MRIRLVCGLVAGCILASVPTHSRAQEMQDLTTYCKEDIDRLCAGIQPGGGRILKCLKGHKKEMSVGCAQALQKLKGKKS